MLSALAVARALQGSIVASQSRRTLGLASTQNRVVTGSSNARTITVGHPAGLSQATTTLGKDGMPASIAYIRTARRLFQGEVLVRDVELSTQYGRVSEGGNAP
jgi:2-methylaconitate cis-trans-isomerase PrpF